MSTGKRIESDFLGQKEIDKGVYYGIQTLRALENFPITGYKISPDLINALAIVKKASAKANADTGLLSSEIAGAIVFACDEIIAGKYHDQFLVDPIQGGAGTSVNMNGNEVIANVALEKLGLPLGSYDKISPNTHVNMAQSTNDAFPTAGHIAMITASKRLLKVLGELHLTFEQKSKEFDDVVKMGRTHLQDAIPIRLGQEFGAYAAVLSRDIKRISSALDGLHTVNIGATAIGTGLNADPLYIEKAVNYLKEETGMPIRLADNLVDGTQNTDAYTELSSMLKICMINMSKVANDLRIMASGPRTGIFEINLPPRQPGSSIMPGKVNPVMAELVNQIAFQVIGNDQTVSLASEAGQLELNVMEPVMFFNLLQSICIMTNGLHVFTDFCVSGITANKKRAKELVENSLGIITALNPHIGYENASKVVKEALTTGQKIRDICLRENFLTEAELNIILDIFEMTEIGISGVAFLK